MKINDPTDKTNNNLTSVIQDKNYYMPFNIDIDTQKRTWLTLRFRKDMSVLFYNNPSVFPPLITSSKIDTAVAINKQTVTKK